MKAKPFLLIFSFFLFISCSQETLNIKECHFYIIYDYSGKNQVPQQSLSVFVATNVDVRKLDEIKVTDLSSDFFWQTKDLYRFTTSEKNYAGYPSFKVPEGDSFSDGTYEITITTKDGNSINYTVHLNTNKQLLLQKAEETELQCKNMNASEYITIYNAEKKLLFYGKKSDDLQNAKDVWLRYNNAASFNTVWVLDNKSATVIMPAQKVESGENNE
ncbi:MAG: hypothetical protein MJ179_02905 [Treponema sp.]|nr:hypothetical protein [Treponema sp.]